MSPAGCGLAARWVGGGDVQTPVDSCCEVKLPRGLSSRREEEGASAGDAASQVCSFASQHPRASAGRREAQGRPVCRGAAGPAVCVRGHRASRIPAQPPLLPQRLTASPNPRGPKLLLPANSPGPRASTYLAAFSLISGSGIRDTGGREAFLSHYVPSMGECAVEFCIPEPRLS
jgi:hypothetical protein